MFNEILIDLSGIKWRKILIFLTDRGREEENDTHRKSFLLYVCACDVQESFMCDSIQKKNVASIFTWILNWIL